MEGGDAMAAEGVAVEAAVIDHVDMGLVDRLLASGASRDFLTQVIFDDLQVCLSEVALCWVEWGGSGEYGSRVRQRSTPPSLFL